jgi:hypothetical protein
VGTGRRVTPKSKVALAALVRSRSRGVGAALGQQALDGADVVADGVARARQGRAGGQHEPVVVAALEREARDDRNEVADVLGEDPAPFVGH